MVSLVEQVAAFATRVGRELKALRTAKADDAAVVHLSGAETVSGTKTFGSPPVIPVGTALGHPVRRDDARLTDTRTPTDGTVTNAKVAAGAAIAESKLALASDAPAATASRRTLGTASTQAAAGDHTHAGAQGPRGDTGPAGTPGDAITVHDAGTASAEWTPSAANGSRQKAVLASAVTLSGPSNPPRDGFRVSFALRAVGAARVLTIAAGIGRLAGWPDSIQLAVGKLAIVRLEWSADLGRWVLLTMTQEA